MVKEFLKGDKNLLIAPAGYGKTYTLAECLQYTPVNEKQLILTHTHAGIASIKEKIKSKDVPSSKYNIETITGFAQRYVLALYSGDLEVEQGDKQYFNNIIKVAIRLFKADAVKRIVTASYNGLFVDEYQDCDILQHEMIMLLSDMLPTRLLGDEMQGIFDFSSDAPLVSFEYNLKGFKITKLETPWRWKSNGNNENLGEDLKVLRGILESDNKVIDLREFQSINIKILDYDLGVEPHKCYDKTTERIDQQAKEKQNLLYITPDTYEHSNINRRIKFQNLFSGRLSLLESFDEKAYYSVSKSIDNIINSALDEAELYNIVKNNMLTKLFNNGDINSWFGDNKVKNKRGDHKTNSAQLKHLTDILLKYTDALNLNKLLSFIINKLKFKTTRPDLVYGIKNALTNSIENDTTVYEAMVQQKNIRRRMGRKISGCSIGTTLLTKGLEFDTVVIIDAHLFKSHKHFYVAITRACKNLIIYSRRNILQF